VEGRPEKEFYFSNARRGGIHTFPSGRFHRDNFIFTNHIEAESDFFKNLAAFKLKTRLPVGGVVYEATFVYPRQGNQS
jgi:hypothetical protein